MKRDFYQEVTDSIVKLIETGEGTSSDWRKDLTNRGMPKNYKTKQSYNGVNIFLLWGASVEHNFKTNYWLTFKQAAELGGNVQKGATGVLCVFFKTLEKADENDDGSIVKIPMISPFLVFNIDQINGIDFSDVIEKENKEENEAHILWERKERAEAILYADNIKIIEQGDRAFYRRSTDEVYLPERDRFDNAEHFYAVGFHEKTHWTGCDKRLAREFGKRFADDAYAFEELVAELGAAFLCAEVGIVCFTMSDHAGYISSWLKVLKNDKRAIFTAANRATAAHHYILEGAAVLEQQAA